MIKIEVVEFFKPYNIALRFKFKNPKYKGLILNFELNSNLIKFCPFEGKFYAVLDIVASFHAILCTNIITFAVSSFFSNGLSLASSLSTSCI
jgi:hypothetical protein